MSIEAGKKRRGRERARSLNWLGVGCGAAGLFACGLGIRAAEPGGGGPPATAASTQPLNSLSGQTNPKVHPLEISPMPDAPYRDPANGKMIPPATAPTNLFREGQSIFERTGHLRPDADGQMMEFTLDPTDQELAQGGAGTPEGAPRPPLLVLPNQKLMQMENALRDGSHDLRFRISGLITEYHNRNYVLLGSAMVANDSTTVPVAEGDGGTANVKPATRQMSSAERLDAQLKPRHTDSVEIAPLPEQPAAIGSTIKTVAPTTAPVNLLREGFPVADRTGRLRESADGQWKEFIFDADRQSMKDPPLILLPNQKLVQMENAVRDGSRDLRFRISGTVTEYHGRNYILLEKMLVIPDVMQQF